MMPPIVRVHDGIHVVREDLYPGGTKARYVARIFEGADEVVYASPCQGGAQFAMAWVARELGKKATFFVARRKEPHPRAFEAKALGAKVVQVPCGYLTTGMCCICNATLISKWKHRGIGPICAQKFGW